MRGDGSGGNILFHGVPGGHEFNSFVIALYNMAGQGQPVDEELKNRLRSIKRRRISKVMVSLSCTMCPEVVMAAQSRLFFGIRDRRDDRFETLS